MGLALGIDVGTTTLKTALVETDELGVTGRSAAEHGTQRPRAGWAEQRPEDWWTHLLDLLAPLRGQLGGVEAVAVAGQGSTFVPCGAGGAALRPAISWQDSRAVALANRIGSELAAEIERANGNAIGDAPEPKLVWLREREPATWDRLETALTASAWISVQLGAEPRVNEGDAGSWIAFNRGGRGFDGAIASALGVSDKLPGIAALGERIGEVCDAASKLTGIPRGTPLFASTTDVAAAAIAAGAAAPGDAHYSKGTGAFLCAHVRSVEHPGALLALPVGDGATHQLCGATDSLGSALDWCCGLLGINHAKAFKLAEAARPRAGGVVALPWLQGAQHPVLDPRARGVLAGLSLETGPGEVVRSLLSATARDLRAHLDLAREASGESFVVVVSSGGPTRAAFWNRLDAAAAGVPVRVAPLADAAVGSALVAAEAAGLIADPVAAGRSLQTEDEVYEPEAALVDELASSAPAAKELAAAVRPLFTTLARLAQGDARAPHQPKLADRPN
jgi:xylulokinase